jgi:hypothetical protein
MKTTPGRPTLGALALLLAALFTACQSAPTRMAPDLRRLQGYWEGYGPGGKCSVTISGNSLHFRARADFWFETTFTLPAGGDPRQLHATIISSPEKTTIGSVVVVIFEIEDGTLNLGVIEDFDGPPTDPVLGDWDRAMDRYYLERAQPQEQTQPPKNEEAENAIAGGVELGSPPDTGLWGPPGAF